MAKILGIGGIFFTCEDPAALREWYARVLGFELAHWGGASFPPQPRGQSTWSPFPANTKYFAPSERGFMINFMVDDLDAVLARAADAGVTPLGRDDQEYGRFAWLLDPAGVKIELWEPAAAG